MNTAYFGMITTVCSLFIAALSLIFSYSRNKREDTRRDQKLSDTLDNISKLIGEVRDDVKKLDGRLDEHSIAIAEIREKIKTLFEQISELKSRIDKIER